MNNSDTPQDIAPQSMQKTDLRSDLKRNLLKNFEDQLSQSTLITVQQRERLCKLISEEAASTQEIIRAIERE